MKNILYFVLAVVAIYFFIGWSNDHDKKIESLAKNYEECVRVQYGVSPATWYEENGKYPICPVRISEIPPKGDNENKN